MRIFLSDIPPSDGRYQVTDYSVLNPGADTGFQKGGGGGGGCSGSS